MDFHLVVNPEEEDEGLDENEEGEGVNQPDKGEKSNKCSQCDYVSPQADNLRRHLRRHTVEKSQTNATSVTLPVSTQVL